MFTLDLQQQNTGKANVGVVIQPTRAALKTSVYKCHWYEKIQCNDKWGKTRSKMRELHFNRVKNQREKSERKPLRALIFNQQNYRGLSHSFFNYGFCEHT